MMQLSRLFQSRPHLKVSAKISLGFLIVLVLHLSIAAIGHWGLRKSDRDLATFSQLHQQVRIFQEIDRDVAELQRHVLLFAFSGYRGPEERAIELEDCLRVRLDKAAQSLATSDDSSHEMADSLEQMQQHLAIHREIFEAVVEDRAYRRKLVNEVLVELGTRFDQTMKRMEKNYGDSKSLAEINAAFQSARHQTMLFVNDPDSAHVRTVKQHLGRARSRLEGLRTQEPTSSDAELQAALQNLKEYDTAVIQMVQATRGYLHLVNVVLAGESVEFRRLASEIRTQQSQHVDQLAGEMAYDNAQFQKWSNLFSLFTIALGILAAMWISRNVAPPLNDITETFDRLSQGESIASIPGLDRHDELGRLANAAQVFKDKARETERFLEESNQSRGRLNALNAKLAAQTELANSLVQETRAATTAKSEFLANMSHEIRTPMTAILGFAETIAESTADEETRESIGIIQRNGEHLLGIINDILDLSKVEAGKMNFVESHHRPMELMQEVRSLIEVKADGAGLAFHIETEGKIPETIYTDAARLRQILINLVGNAIKFTEVGEVRLVARYRSDTPEPMMEFDVIDTGIGMTPSQTDRLFQPFSQADSSMSRQFGGTGLGLTISKRFAERLGGSLIILRSAPKQGSCFRLSVRTGSMAGVRLIHPQETPDQPTREESPQAQTNHQALEGRRILLVEDGPDNQRLIAFVLKKAGADITIEDNGQKAIECIEANQDTPFDCVLMDMQMPVLDGYQATRELRLRGQNLPIIALTAHAMTSSRQECLNAGCDDFATKPIDRNLLIETIATWCNHHANSFSCDDD